MNIKVQSMLWNILLSVIFCAVLTGGQVFDVEKNDPACGTGNIQVGREPVPFNFKVNSVTADTLTCSYKVTTHENSYLVFNVTSLNVYDKNDCTKGFMNVSSTIEGLKTGKQICKNYLPPEPLESLGNEMYILIFLTKSATERHVTGTFTRVVYPNEEACGPEAIRLENDSATLTIPTQGKQFNSPTKCVYYITGNDQKSLSFQPTKLSFGVPDNCTLNYLKVADDDETISTTKYIYCGNTIPTEVYNSKNNTLYIEMITTLNPSGTNIVGNYYKNNLVPRLSATKAVILLMLAVVAWR